MALNTEPKDLTRGATEIWKKAFSEYSSAEWTLKYFFRGAGGGVDIIAAADGTGFIATISASETSTMSAGDYSWQAEVSKGSEKFIVGSGTLYVKESLSAIDTKVTYETRSSIKSILDKIDAMISGSLDKNVQEYVIRDRQLKHYPLTELIQLREHYARLYAQEPANSNESSSPFMKPVLYRHKKIS